MGIEVIVRSAKNIHYCAKGDFSGIQGLPPTHEQFPIYYSTESFGKNDINESIEGMVTRYLVDLLKEYGKFDTWEGFIFVEISVDESALKIHLYQQNKDGSITLKSVTLFGLSDNQIYKLIEGNSKNVSRRLKKD